jgi:hypothetical protein
MTTKATKGPKKPAKMSGFEKSALQLLRSIDLRLKALTRAADYFHDANESAKESLREMRVSAQIPAMILERERR